MVIIMGEQRKALLLSLILCLAVVSISEIRIVKAESTIYIRADGNVEGTDSIQRFGNVYTLTENISSSVYVQRSDIVIDGAGFAINVDGRGIDLTHWVWVGQNPSNLLHNVTIQNLFMSNGSLIANGGGNHTFYNNNIWRILLYGCGYNKISHCSIDGINLDYGSSNNIVTENNLGYAVEYLSSNNTVDRNYWSNYKTKYPNATEIDNTGIGNQPYVYWIVEIPSSTSLIYQDEHPLMEPVAIPLTDSSPLNNVPEFPSWTPMLMTIIVFAIVLIIYKIKTKQTP
jgi:hypothetical protein